MTTEEKSPFSIYAEGYRDGYIARPPGMPDDDLYMQGYEAGEHDDSLGIENRYDNDETPISPSECKK